jgi:hypothetical protein
MGFCQLSLPFNQKYIIKTTKHFNKNLNVNISPNTSFRVNIISQNILSKSILFDAVIISLFLNTNLCDLKTSIEQSNYNHPPDFQLFGNLRVVHLSAFSLKISSLDVVKSRASFSEIKLMPTSVSSWE